MAWYNTYRPQNFDDVIGQDLVKNILQNALKKNNVRHAYLFAGSKGVGKTTLARIFANELDKTIDKGENAIDIIEMDAASNTGIDDIRGIIESARIPPLAGQYKIFIIDEVHMLSKPAMNALLKILEEPPTYLVFLLATTNPEKLLPTIHSRLTLLKLHNHTQTQIVDRLTYIAKQEKVKIDTSALTMIAKKSEGSQRDAINLLETVASYGLDTYKQEDVSQILGIVSSDLLDMIKEQLQILISGGSPDWKTILDILTAQGTDADTLLVQLTDYALEGSFHGDNSLNSIIPTLVQLQSVKLPLTSVISLLGLLHASIIPAVPATTIHSAKPDKPTPPPSPTPSSLPEKKSEQTYHKSDSTSKDKLSEISESEQEPTTKPEKTSKDEQSSISTVDEVNRSLQQLFSSKHCQPMLKIMAGDLKVESSKDNVVSLSVTNGIFETQLKTKSMQSYLLDHLNSSLQSIFSINVVPRSTKIVSDEANFNFASLSHLDDNDNQHFANDQEHDDSDDSYDSDILPAKTTKNTPDIKAGDIFYSVYRELPMEMKNKKVPVHKNPIPHPRSENQHITNISHDSSASEKDDWDKHSESMFDFE